MSSRVYSLSYCYNMEKHSLTSVLYVTSEEQAENYQWYKDSARIDRNVSVITLDDLEQLRSQVALPRNLSAGMVLIEHPYKENQYLDINQAEEEVFARKMDAITEIARYLGVKRFEAKAEYETTQERLLGVNGEVDYKGVNLEAKYKQEKSEKYKKKYTRIQEWPGGFSREGVEKAKQLLKDYCLEQERVVQHLIAQREGDLNQMTSFTETLSLSQEFNERTDVAFTLSAMKGVLGLKAGIETTFTYKVEVNLFLKLEF